MFNKQKKFFITFLMSVLAVCLLGVPAFASGGGTGGGGSDPTLTFVNANLCTISGQTATAGVSLVNNSSVAYGSQHIEIQLNHNVASDMTIDGTLPVLSTNQASIHLTDLSTQTTVPISVYRLGDGTPTDPEKQHLFFDANLVGGDSYEITLDPSVICYNCTTLGAVQLVDFTVTQ